MELVFGALALLFTLFVVLGVVVTLRVVRAVRRGVERTGVQVRRTVEETTLKARGAQPGPVGEAARLRLQLRSSIDGTRQVLEAGVASDPSLRESLTLLDQLHEHARQLDGELRTLMEGEPDRARLAERLPEARERSASIRESADALRSAAQERASRHGAEGLDALRQQIDIESGALRHWEGAGQGGHPAGSATAGAEGPRSGADASEAARSGEADGFAGPRGAERPAGARGPEGEHGQPGPPKSGPRPEAAEPRALEGDSGPGQGGLSDFLKEKPARRPDPHQAP